MAAAAREVEAEFPMQEPTVLEKKVERVQEDVAVLKADVKVLQSDVGHLKADTKRIDAKVDAIGASLTEHRIETERSFAKVREEMKDGFAALRAEIATLRIEMKDSFGKFRDRRFTQIGWIIGTVIASIGTAVTVLKFFTAA